MNLTDKVRINATLVYFKLLEKLFIILKNETAKQEASCNYWALINLIRKKDGHLESASGPGSTLETTMDTRAFIEESIQQFKITSIVDIGCGDWNWMSQLHLHGASYLGLDVVSHTVLNNQAAYGDRKGVTFKEFNAITEIPPQVDLVIIRDVLFHLSNDHAAQVLNNIRDSGSKYLLTTTFPDESENRPLENYGENLSGWGFHKLNIELPPFNLSNPVASVFEKNENREMRVYKIN